MVQGLFETVRRETAEAVRDACLRAVLESYEYAGLSGLCEEGRWEMVVDSIKSLDLASIVGVLSVNGHTSANMGTPTVSDS